MNNYPNPSLKCSNSNSTWAVHSGFDLHRFLQVLSHFDLNLCPADPKRTVRIELELTDFKTQMSNYFS